MKPAKHNRTQPVITSFLLVLLITFLSTFQSCTTQKQANALKSLSKSSFELIGVDSLILAGTSIDDIWQRGELNMSSLPGVAMAFLSRDLPLQASVQLQITNPTKHLAGIKQFEYIILMDQVEMITGTSDLPIEVKSNSTAVVPVKINANIYKLVSNRNQLNKLLALLENKGEEKNSDQIALTFKIKPTISLGNKTIDYPGYININKTLDSKTLSRAGIKN